MLHLRLFARQRHFSLFEYSFLLDEDANEVSSSKEDEEFLSKEGEEIFVRNLRLFQISSSLSDEEKDLRSFHLQPIFNYSDRLWL